MEVLKSFLSHILSFILFLAIAFLSISFLCENLLTYEVIYDSLEKSKTIEKALDNNADLQEIDIPDKLVEYSKIDEIIYNYVTTRILYEFKMVDSSPVIDIVEVNERLGMAIEKYIDDELDEYTGGLHSFLIDAGIDLGLEDEIKKYLSDKTSIDLMGNEIVKESDLEKIYEYVDSVIAGINKNDILSNCVEVINNYNYRWYAVWTIIICAILIAAINLSFTSLFGYSIAPVLIHAIIFGVGYLLTSNIDFQGSIKADVLNIIEEDLAIVLSRYTIVFVLITIILILLYYISKNLRIAMFHKKGVTTLDTVFDDYNIDEVLKEMSAKEEMEKEQSKKNTTNSEKTPKTKKTNTKNKKKSNKNSTKNSPSTKTTNPEEPKEENK